MSPFIRTLRAHEGETVEIAWACTDGTVFVQKLGIPPKAVGRTESPGTTAT